MSELGNRSRVTLDVEDWMVVVELVKIRFAELVELGQTVDGAIKQTHRDAALELWPIIKDMELQIPSHRRRCEKCKRITGPLRDWQAAAKRLGLTKVDIAPLAVIEDEPDARELSNLADTA